MSMFPWYYVVVDDSLRVVQGMAYVKIWFGIFVPIVILALFCLSYRFQARPASYPPGPPAIPVLGNLHQIPLAKSFLKFAEWNRTYGSHGLVGLHIGPSAKAVVLNNWKVVRDLLDQRGAVYSSRPYVPIVEYVVPPPGDIHLVFMPYGPKWRKTRKTFTDFLKDSEVEKLRPIQDAESSQLMYDLLRTPKKHYDHVSRCFGAVILASVFGTRGKEYSDTGKIKRFFEVQGEWAHLLEMGSMPPFDVFPFLRYIPDALTPWRGWRKRAESLKQQQSGLYHELFVEAKERIERGRSQDCFVAQLLRTREDDGYTDVELEYIGGFLMEGGSDTTAGAFETFILAMAAHPEIQKEAQKEIDSAYEDQMPTSQTNFHDLPFLRACFLETLRWRPGANLSIPHATTQDDVYGGFSIAAGTTILMNVWAIQHDPDEYENPDSFDPSRFLKNPLGIKYDADKHSKVAAGDISRRPIYAFGAGRRVCAGQRMAENSMLMAMAKLIWSFDVVAVPELGKLDTSVHAFKDAILTSPRPFDVNFVVRDERRQQAIEQMWGSADEFLKRFE
ncbi:cytochrome P450 [Xylariaceae sp. FL0662B]|nr:cytochrome P450 [Xylariaceae sp. FL0662B]